MVLRVAESFQVLEGMLQCCKKHPLLQACDLAATAHGSRAVICVVGKTTRQQQGQDLTYLPASHSMGSPLCSKPTCGPA